MEQNDPNPNKHASASGAEIVGGPKTDMQGPGPEVMAAKTLQSNDVYNRQDEKLGSIQDIMLDVQHGRVAYAVLSKGGVLGVGDKLHAIPWGALTLDTDRKCFILDVSAQRMEEAEGFDKDNWPSMADEAWARKTYDDYGQQPYWHNRM